MELKLHRRNGILYPMLVLAAVSALIFCGVGILALSGLLPGPEPEQQEIQSGRLESPPAAAVPQSTVTRPARAVVTAATT